MKLWITRSQPGASRHAAALGAAGYPCLIQSVLAIEPLPATLPQGAFDRVIFVSEHAVHLGLPRLRAATSGLILPVAAHWLAIGPRTAEALRVFGIESAAQADGYSTDLPRSDSEALLAHPLLSDARGLRVLIVAGAGGRSLIEDTLRVRGARVERFDCYQRVPTLEALPAGAARSVTVIIVGSGEALPAIRTLWRDAGGADDVLLLVPSARVAGLAVAQGFGNVHDCGGAGVSAVLRALQEVKHADSE